VRLERESHDAASDSANVVALASITVRRIFDFGISLFGNGHRAHSRLFTFDEKSLKNRRGVCGTGLVKAVGEVEV